MFWAARKLMVPAQSQKHSTIHFAKDVTKRMGHLHRNSHPAGG
jgi:hypothetical protein